MCGINGVVWRNTIGINRDLFYRSAELNRHRGPDFSGRYSDNQVDLVHHRLSILDLDERSNQPFSSDAYDSVLIYNGEIYNFKELARKYNLNLKTTSDTEVLYDLLNRPQFDLNELNGIFAFAFYNRADRTFQIVRDRLGVKPLYYYENEDFFMFSSEAKVIYNYLPKLEINYQALSEFISFGSSIGNETIITGVKKLGPGCSITVNLDDYSTDSKRFWSIEKNILRYQLNPNYNEAIKKTRELLKSAVERQCVSDVQVGAYLSGGIDSSAVVALASEFTEKKLNTYSVSFDKNPVSELQLASKLAKQYNTNHHEFEVSTDHIDDFLEALVFQYDEPFADPAMIPLHLMAEKASNFSKVVLQGDGGDEIFAGYGRHLDLRYYSYRRLMFNILRKVYPEKEKRFYYFKKHDVLNRPSVSEVMANLVQSNLFTKHKDLFSAALKDQFDGINVLREYELRSTIFDEVPYSQRMLYTDMEIILPHTFLEKVDKVNMMHAIEARVPLLDNELVDYVTRLPQNLKIRKSTSKYFFREVLRGTIPNEILDDRKKSFGTPIENWLRTTLFDYAMAIFDRSEKENIPIDYRQIKQMLINHKNQKTSTNSNTIWRVLILSIWISLYKDKLDFLKK